MKQSTFNKIHEYFTANSGKSLTIESIAKELEISGADVAQCLDDFPSHFIKLEGSEAYTLNQENVNGEETLTSKSDKSANKNMMFFWFCIFFTITMSLFTIFVSKGN